jgi:SAM-dependent methyltransferase
LATRSVDVVTSRQAAHHFDDINAAVQESARVLKKRWGYMIAIDPLAPASPAVDTWMNEVEVRRDPTHVRDRTMDEWLALLDTAGLTLDDYRITKVYLEFDDWVKRSATPQKGIDRLRRDFIEAAPEVVSAFNIENVNGMITFH